MSYTEKHIGRLVVVDFDKNGTNPADFYKMLCEYHNYNSLTVTKYRNPYTYKSWEEMYWEELWDKDNLYRVDGKVYKLVEHVDIEDDIFKFWKNADGSISFVAEFYNGGTCLSEIIEEGIREVNRNA